MRSDALAGVALGVALLAGSATVSAAGFRWVPYASAETERNSNIFALPDGAAAPEPDAPPPGGALLPILPALPPPPQAADDAGSSRHADTVQMYLAGIEMHIPWGDTRQWRVGGEGRQVRFAHFSAFDHDEYLVRGGLDWRMTEQVEAAFDYRQEERMAPFADRATTELTLETERIGTALVKYALDPRWRVEPGLRARRVASPLPEAPQLELREYALGTAVKYVSVEQFSTGVLAEYLTGDFAGDGSANAFHQESIALTADRTKEDLTRVGAMLGYAQRRDDGSALSALTGALNYHGNLTGKTSIDVEGFNRLQSFVGSAGSVIELGGGAAISWQATHKIALSGGMQMIRAEHHEGAASESRDRSDDSQIASLKLTYQPRPWLSLRPYAGYQERDSNIARYRFRAEFVGFELQARFRTDIN